MTDPTHPTDRLLFGHDIAVQLSELARTLQSDSGTSSVLEDVVEAAVHLIPGAIAASISVVKARRRVESHAASSDLPREVDALQTRTEQGPCLDAAFREQVVRVPDMAAEERWPDFAQGAVELGARSMLSFQLFVDDDKLGALNVYGAAPEAFDEEGEQIGLLVAAHAAVAFSDSRQIEQLGNALGNRDLIGQAKGILMERYKIDAQQAFVMLTAVSSRINVKLTEVALHLTTSGDLLTPSTPPH